MLSPRQWKEKSLRVFLKKLLNFHSIQIRLINLVNNLINLI
jgi:hypothetical protein